MKIALCLSGHSRAHALIYSNYYDNLISKYDVDVFIHTWDTTGYKIDPPHRQKFSTFDLTTNTVDINEIIDVSLSNCIDTTTKSDINEMIDIWNPVMLVREKYSAVYQKFMDDMTPLVKLIKEFNFQNPTMYMPLSA